jgi:hypothetical protein
MEGVGRIVIVLKKWSPINQNLVKMWFNRGHTKSVVDNGPVTTKLVWATFCLLHLVKAITANRK